jgi:two-component sensor histidine kinase
MSFGSRLIERMLGADFAGEVRTFYKAEGVVCELVAPLSTLGIVAVKKTS